MGRFQGAVWVRSTFGQWCRAGAREGDGREGGWVGRAPAMGSSGRNPAQQGPCSRQTWSSPSTPTVLSCGLGTAWGMCELGGPRADPKLWQLGLSVTLSRLEWRLHTLNRDVGPSLQELLSQGSVASRPDLRKVERDRGEGWQ